MTRSHDRAADALRPVTIEAGFVRTATGSALISCGETRVICTASVQESVPRWMSGQGRGWLTAEYGMLPASTGERKVRDIPHLAELWSYINPFMLYGKNMGYKGNFEKELAGPVYLVSSDHTLPDLLADLQGQVDVRLHGVIKTVGKNRIQTSFAPIPDVPVSKFTLTMQGGKKGLLVNSKDVCSKRYFSRIEFNAQNGKSSLNKRSPLHVGNGCHGVKKHKAHKKKRHHKKKHAKHAKGKGQRAAAKKGKNSHK